MINQEEPPFLLWEKKACWCSLRIESFFESSATIFKHRKWSYNASLILLAKHLFVVPFWCPVSHFIQRWQGVEKHPRHKLSLLEVQSEVADCSILFLCNLILYSRRGGEKNLQTSSDSFQQFYLLTGRNVSIVSIKFVLTFLLLALPNWKSTSSFNFFVFTVYRSLVMQNRMVLFHWRGHSHLVHANRNCSNIGRGKFTWEY